MTGTTEAPERPLTLPTQIEFDAAKALAADLLDQLQEVQNDLRRVIDATLDRPIDRWPAGWSEAGFVIDGVAVDAAYIGDLYTFIQDVTQEHERAGDELKRLRDDLERLNLARTDIVAYATSVAAASGGA